MIQLEQIYFIITRRCNLFCDHCIRSSGPGITDSLGVEDFSTALEKLVPFAKNSQILISGGEPTLHNDFQEMVRVACSLYPEVVINTNGLRKSHLIKAHEVSGGKLKVQVSIDGNEDLHDSIRGKGSFQRSMNTIHELSKHNISVIVATTVGRSNVSSMSGLDKILYSVDFSYWTIQREVIYGRASLKENNLNTTTWNDFAVKSQRNFQNTKRLKISTMFDWYNMSNTLKKNQPNKVMNCGTGSKKIYINPDLTVFPCGCMEEVRLGDLIKDSGEQIIMNMQKIFSNNMIKNPICSSCPFKSICNGGCPGASKNYFGEFGKGDPRCPAIYDLSIKAVGENA